MLNTTYELNNVNTILLFFSLVLLGLYNVQRKNKLIKEPNNNTLLGLIKESP